MGNIHLEQMEFYAYHRHYREEQIVGNKFLVDVIIETDMTVPAGTDDLADALNYQAAYKLIRKGMEIKSKLLDNIAKRIMDVLYREMSGIQKLTVTIRKMTPPVGGKMKSVSVTLSS
jgi:dihydroneopterin aldolase